MLHMLIAWSSFQLYLYGKMLICVTNDFLFALKAKFIHPQGIPMIINRLLCVWLSVQLVILSGCGSTVEGVQQEGPVLKFKMKALDGKDINLSRYEGDVVMVVNVASKCGFTGQYEQLQQLHEKYANQGLAILGFPCNQFLGQEPGTAEEIEEFCRVNYGVTFQMFAKIDVKDDNACEFYQELTSIDTKPKGPGEVSWNFEKFLIDRNGNVIARFGSGTKPDAPEVIAMIEEELARQPEEKPRAAEGPE